MAAGDITWFRYAPHGGLEGEVPAGTVTAPGHHSHYSVIEEIAAAPGATVLVKAIVVGAPVKAPAGDVLVMLRPLSWSAARPAIVVDAADVVSGASMPSTADGVSASTGPGTAAEAALGEG